MKCILSIIAMFITLTEPSSFISIGEVSIYDYTPSHTLINGKKGGLFYYHPGAASLTGNNFNLPKGTYKVDDDAFIYQLPEFKPFPLIDIPEADTAYSGMELKMDPAGNPNKASFYPSKNHAIFDPWIVQHEFYPVFFCCASHEQGHTYFRSGPGHDMDFLTAEHLCDCYAYNKSMKNGYNPNQVKTAFKLLLSPDNPRLQMLIDKIDIANEKVI